MSEIEVESTEEWRPVVGFEGIYSVSSMGRVRRDAPGYGTYCGRLIQGSVTGNGHRKVTLTKDGNQYSCFIHHLVAKAFIGPRPEGLDIAHNNGVKTDNRVENLRYTSHSDNLLDGYRYGGKVSTQKLSLQDVSDIRYLLDAGYKAKDLAFAFKCSESAISDIKHGRKWSHRLDQTLLVPTAD